MKKYTDLRVSLLIALLSLNALSACVGKSQPMVSEDNFEHNKSALGVTHGSSRSLHKHSSKRMYCYLCALGVVLPNLIPITIYAFLHNIDYFIGLFARRSGYMNNDSRLTISPLLISPKQNTIPISYTTTTITPELGTCLTNVIKDGQEKWGANAASSDPNMSTPSTRRIAHPLRRWRKKVRMFYSRVKRHKYKFKGKRNHFMHALV